MLKWPVQKQTLKTAQITQSNKTLQTFRIIFCCEMGHFVMVPLNMTYLHCLQHSLFEHLFNLYCSLAHELITNNTSTNVRGTLGDVKKEKTLNDFEQEST